MSTIKHCIFLALPSFLMLFVVTGCGTTMKISGSPGTEFSGHFRTSAHEQKVNGVLVPWSVTVAGNGNRFEECEFQKPDRQDDLILEIRRHGAVAARVEAPSGVLGVKARQEGSAIVAETIP